MNILIVSQYFWPENFRINDLSQELVKRGHAVTVLTGIPNYPDGKVFPSYDEAPEKFRHYSGASVIRVPMLARGTGPLRLMLNYLSFVLGAGLFGPWKLRGQDFDVIFVYEPSPVTVGLPAILLGRLKRAPVVFWVLDLWPETLAAIGVVRSPKLLAVVGRLVSFIYNRCTLVLGQSRGFLEGIARYCTDVSKIRYFPSWAEEFFVQEGCEPAIEVPRKEGVFSIMFAGNIGEAQDFPAVLAAAEALSRDPTIRWIVVGDGRKMEWLREEVARRDLSHCVLLLGRFGIERMPSFFAHADALLVSLKRDPVFSLTIPGKVQPYLMSGIPILGMLDGEGAEVIRDANAGLVCPSEDAKGLALAAKQMASMSKEDLQRLGSNGREYAQKEFSRESLMSKLEEWFEEVASINSTD